MKNLRLQAFRALSGSFRWKTTYSTVIARSPTGESGEAAGAKTSSGAASRSWIYWHRTCATQPALHSF
jgi:hypothetical protein